jgi:hypothetical protein
MDLFDADTVKSESNPKVRDMPTCLPLDLRHGLPLLPLGGCCWVGRSKGSRGEETLRQVCDPSSGFQHTCSIIMSGRRVKTVSCFYPQPLCVSLLPPALSLRSFTRQAQVCRHLQQEGRGCSHLVLWLDCDREGENICFEASVAARQPTTHSTRCSLVHAHS